MCDSGHGSAGLGGDGRHDHNRFGFLVDTPAIRAMAKAFGWDQPDGDEPGTDLEHDLFAHYTLLQKH